MEWSEIFGDAGLFLFHDMYRSSSTKGYNKSKFYNNKKKFSNYSRQPSNEGNTFTITNSFSTTVEIAAGKTTALMPIAFNNFQGVNIYSPLASSV